MGVALTDPFRFQGTGQEGEDGVYLYDTPGTYQFDVPSFTTLTVYVYGGGGPSQSFDGSYDPGTLGGYSAFDDGGADEVKANPGGLASGNSGGAGGTATGGDTNTPGDAGTGYGSSDAHGNGGANNGPEGGATQGTLGGLGQHPAEDGKVYGGGASGKDIGPNFLPGGGGSGYAKKVWTSPAGPSGLVTVEVGAGGLGVKGVTHEGAHGADGAVKIVVDEGL